LIKIVIYYFQQECGLMELKLKCHYSEPIA